MKSKIEKIPIYCFNCGSELKQEKFISHYDEESGEAQYRVRVHCKTCQENGNLVYHQQEWKINSQDKEEELTDKKKAIDKGVDRDTPEEWEKRFIRTFGYWDEEIKFIKQLLDEREREVVKNFLDTTASYNKFFNGEPRKMGKEGGVKYEIVVNKLNSKKE